MASSIQEKTRSTPERIFTSLNAYQRTAALKTAIELDIFTAIGQGGNDATTLARKTGAAERGIRILCDFLTIQGFLMKDANRYALTDESADISGPWRHSAFRRHSFLPASCSPTDERRARCWTSPRGTEFTA